MSTIQHNSQSTDKTYCIFIILENSEHMKEAVCVVFPRLSDKVIKLIADVSGGFQPFHIN